MPQLTPANPLISIGLAMLVLGLAGHARATHHPRFLHNHAISFGMLGFLGVVVFAIGRAGGGT